MLPGISPEAQTKRIVPGEDAEANYRRAVRENLTEICGELEIPILYRPGIVNSPDFSVVLLCLALYGRVKKLEGSIAKLKRDEKKKSTPTKRKGKASA